MLAFENSNIWYHVFEEPLGVVGAQMTHINNHYFFKTDVFKNVFVHWHWFVVLWRVLLVHPFKHSLSENVIFKVVIPVEVHCLFCCILILIPLVIPIYLTYWPFLIMAGDLQRWILFEQLHHFCRSNIRLCHEFH